MSELWPLNSHIPPPLGVVLLAVVERALTDNPNTTQT